MHLCTVEPWLRDRGSSRGKPSFRCVELSNVDGPTLEMSSSLTLCQGSVDRPTSQRCCVPRWEVSLPREKRHLARFVAALVRSDAIVGRKGPPQIAMTGLVHIRPMFRYASRRPQRERESLIGATCRAAAALADDYVGQMHVTLRGRAATRSPGSVTWRDGSHVAHRSRLNARRPRRALARA